MVKLWVQHVVPSIIHECCHVVKILGDARFSLYDLVSLLVAGRGRILLHVPSGLFDGPPGWLKQKIPATINLGHTEQITFVEAAPADETWSLLINGEIIQKGCRSK